MVQIIAHRGAPEECPENTIKSIGKAIDLGADMIEVDARLSKDKIPVIMHDPTLDRTAKRKGYVEDKMWAQLRKIKVGGENIPSLEDVIKTIKNRCRLNIHIKVHEAISHILRLIKKYDIEEDVLLSSFSVQTLKKIRETAPKIKTALIFSSPRLRYISAAKKLKLYSIHPHYNIITKRMVLRAHKNDIKVNVWTIRKRRSALKSKYYYNVDGIISDDPLLYREKAGRTFMQKLVMFFNDMKTGSR
ncbi:hypothetical protein GF336_06470 [Candidatus Woesearchaeota archaeon]|nr:hypothetical protein [Candidatus Woesearchaeota archaeon]